MLIWTGLTSLRPKPANTVPITINYVSSCSDLNGTINMLKFQHFSKYLQDQTNKIRHKEIREMEGNKIE